MWARLFRHGSGHASRAFVAKVKQISTPSLEVMNLPACDFGCEAFAPPPRPVAVASSAQAATTSSVAVSCVAAFL